MSDTLQPSGASARPSLAARAFLIGTGLVATAILGTGAVLWAHYGTAVFFEMIAVGIAACF